MGRSWRVAALALAGAALWAGCEKQDWLAPKALAPAPAAAMQLPLDGVGGTGNSSLNPSPLSPDPYATDAQAEPEPPRDEAQNEQPSTEYLQEGVGGSGPQEPLPEGTQPTEGAEGKEKTDRGGARDATKGTGGAGTGTDSDRAEGLSHGQGRDTGE